MIVLKIQFAVLLVLLREISHEKRYRCVQLGDLKIEFIADYVSATNRCSLCSNRFVVLSIRSD